MWINTSASRGVFILFFSFLPIFDIYKSFSVLAVSLPIVMKQSALGSKLDIKDYQKSGKRVKMAEWFTVD